MPGASPSSRNSLILIAVWTHGGTGQDSGRAFGPTVLMQMAEEQSASLSTSSRPQTFTAFLKVIPVFTG